MIDTEHFNEVMEREGYLAYRIIGPDRWVAIAPHFIFTVAIVEGAGADLDFGYSRRWCYHDSHDAVVAMCEWYDRNFAGKPINWIREV